MMPGTTFWGAGNGSAGGYTTIHPTITSGGGFSSPNGAGIPPATPGSTTSPYASNTTQMAGPNGPFSSLGSPLTSNATALMGAGSQVLNTAMDPQNALYNRELQKQRDSTNVNEAQRGITMSPYGAGVASQADTNFNIDWQNSQLGRQRQGIDAAAAAMNPASSLYRDSFGSSTQGYTTNPPPGERSMGGSQGAPSGGGGLPYTPQYSPAVSYASPISPQQQPFIPGSTTASQTPGYMYPSDTNPMYTQAGVDYNAINSPSAQQQMTPQQLYDSVTGSYPQAMSDANGTSYVGDTSMTADQLINSASQPSMGYGEIMGVTNDAGALSLLAGWGSF